MDLKKNAHDEYSDGKEHLVSNISKKAPECAHSMHLQSDTK